MSHSHALTADGFQQSPDAHAVRYGFLRVDTRYRRRRLSELAELLKLNIAEASVLDIGCGTGRLLASFPSARPYADGTTFGATVSGSSLGPIVQEEKWGDLHGDTPAYDELPEGPFDVVISSQLSNQSADESVLIDAVMERLRPGGLFFFFVGLNGGSGDAEPGHHQGLESITGCLKNAGFRLVHAEGGVRTMKSLGKDVSRSGQRRPWSLRPLIHGFRLVTLSLLPYQAIRMLDRRVARSHRQPTQGFILALKPSTR